MIKRPELTKNQIDRFKIELRAIAAKENVPVEADIIWILSKPKIANIENKLSIKSQSKVKSMLAKIDSRDY